MKPRNVFKQLYSDGFSGGLFDFIIKTSLLFGCLRLKPPFSHPNDTNLYKLRCCWIFTAKKKEWMIFNFNSAMNFDLFSEMDFVLLLISY